MDRPVVVVGAGIAGTACARALREAGLDVQVRDRGRRIGGRMAASSRGGRPADVGASYFTARGEGFGRVVDDWHRRGLARPWTDTFAVAGPDGLHDSTSGPVRWGAPRGLRSLVEDLARGLAVQHPVEVEDVGPGPTVDGRRVAAVVLAMPDPQALDILADELVEERAALDRPWEPALAVTAAWPERCWPDVDGVFVHDDAALTWIADDGRRRGDGAPVLVAHSTAELASRHLDVPDAATGELVRAVRRVLAIPRPPRWTEVKRWSLARPAQPREEPYLLTDAMVGVCGDGWAANPRVEGAYDSGTALGRELARRLAG